MAKFGPPFARHKSGRKIAANYYEGSEIFSFPSISPLYLGCSGFKFKRFETLIH